MGENFIYLMLELRLKLDRDMGRRRICKNCILGQSRENAAKKVGMEKERRRKVESSH